MNEETHRILTNKELIKINQDKDCCQVFKLPNHWNDNVKIYARNLENGDIAVGMFNFGGEKAVVRITVDELGIPESTDRTLKLENVWDDETVTVTNGAFIHDIEPYDCLVYRCKVVKK